MTQTLQFVRVDFHRFKAFETFAFQLRHFNILVGPNNAGKSTILAAFRILAAAIRKATSRKPEMVNGPLNPILTQLAKTRRAIFVEGKDFQILGKFARKLGVNAVSNRSEFAVIPVEGFSPERIRSLKKGIETTLGGKIMAMAIMDKDYRCDKECDSLIAECQSFCDFVVIHKCKEIENFLLVPTAISRATARRIADAAKRTGKKLEYSTDTATLLDNFADSKKNYLMAQYLDFCERFERSNSQGQHKAKIKEEALNEFEGRWKNSDLKLEIIPGKEALGAINKALQEKYGVNITPTAIVDAMKVDEIPDEMKKLIKEITKFSLVTVN